ncbi:hypothetical protein [Natronohydrobacter thiooxidans]|uniref:hypothetical protein n=1 Tax=Natronohydrobacter thiooxidans TaxID=87172 RepID=UPI000A65D9DD|nr:hypothetical protein [Natronohydrobacter thiooxidans]
MKTQVFAASIAALLGTTSLAHAVEISEVDVSADLTTIEDARAAEFWTTLETDLESAVLSRIAERISEDGARLVLNIESFALNDAPESGFTIDSAALIGRVHVIDLNNNANFDSYELSVSLQGMSVTDESGAPILVADMPEDLAYRTLVDAFADHVAERLD